MTNEKKIITAASIFLLTSFVFLSFVEWKAIDPAGKISWWTVYFEDSKSTDNLSFTIENNGQAKKLHWKEIAGEESHATVKEADVLVPAGQKSTISLLGLSITQKEKISIEVTDMNGGKKDIYKVINQ